MSEQTSMHASVRKGNHTMSGRKAAVLMTGLVLAAGLCAPSASARPNCQSNDFTTVCQTNGSVSIKARPGTVAPPANMPHMPWLGMPGRRR